MPPPDRTSYGPEQAVARDIEPLNRLFSEAFTDRYGRDGLVGVRVPHLSPLVWRYALEDAGPGAMLWRDAEGALTAFNMVHRSGTEGWMGPLAVRPDRQADGLGSTMVRAGVEWLKGQGARTIGLETMPRTVENIGFYSRLGFRPEHLTITLVREVGRGGAAGELLSQSPHEVESRIGECRQLTERLRPGVDYTRELVLTRELRLGDTSMVREGSELIGFALWHSTPLAAGRPRDELRVLKVAARDVDALALVIAAVDGAAREERLRRVSLRCQTAYAEAYAMLIASGFRVHWTDLRMTWGEFREPVAEPGVVMSNWEI